MGGECLSQDPQVHIDKLLLELDSLDNRTGDARKALEDNKEDGIVQSAKALGHAHEGLHGM